jgi:hypothetical protein
VLLNLLVNALQLDIKILVAWPDVCGKQFFQFTDVNNEIFVILLFLFINMCKYLCLFLKGTLA